MIPEKTTIPFCDLIAPEDQMYVGNKEHYFHCGHSALLLIKKILFEYESVEPGHILDFACGYGRVLRFLRAGFPKAHTSVFDTNKNAARFCVEKLKADTDNNSLSHLQKIAAVNPFDLIWCGSFFTHIPAHKAHEYINLFHKILQPDGILIFTTHGNFSFQQLQIAKITYGLKTPTRQKIIREFREKNYGFQPYRWFGSYGIAIATPEWYQNLLTSEKGWSQSGFCQKTWDNHQDIHYARKNESGEKTG